MSPPCFFEQLTETKEWLDDKGSEKLMPLLRTGDASGYVASCCKAKDAASVSSRPLISHSYFS
jgi:hypothetical protein